MTERDLAVGGIDTTTPNVARIYDYLLGGKDNFAADRAAAGQLIAAIPDVAAIARDNRSFLGRVVRYLAGQAGVRQFLDLGGGLPTRANVHELAQGVAPDVRVVLRRQRSRGGLARPGAAFHPRPGRDGAGRPA